jgi:hypothetical protein
MITQEDKTINAISQTQKKEYKGLKRLRAVKGRYPTLTCDNCKCMRYTPCGCMRKK